jgi:hypothetical protein
MRRVSVLHFTLYASKIYDVSNRRFLDEKWQGLDFTLLLNSALQCSHNKSNCLAISSQMYCGLQTHALRPNTNPAGGSGLWHSALKLGPLTIAIRDTAIFSVAIRLENTAICQYSVTNLSAEFSNRVESSPRHFSSRLFDTS